MIGQYLVLAERIRLELHDLERVVARVERGWEAGKTQAQDQDLYIDSVALNLHDFYSGVERVLQRIAATVDASVPSGRDWHRDVLLQMSTNLSDIRPQVLASETAVALDDYLRFRHVVRNIYAFEFDAVRLEHLVQQLRQVFERVQVDLIAFADFLEQISRED